MNRAVKNLTEVSIMKHPRMHRTPPREQGAVLAIGLIFLVVMTLLGVTAMSTTSLENKMAGNLKDWSLALQASEGGLRDAEIDIATTQRVSGMTNAVAGCQAVTSSANEKDGQCTSAPSDTQSIWNLIDWTDSASPQYYVKYGNKTGAGTYAYIAAQGFATVPRYIIEPVNDHGKPGTSLVGLESNKTKTFRVTAVGYGGSTQASVMLQSTYVLP